MKVAVLVAFLALLAAPLAHAEDLVAPDALGTAISEVYAYAIEIVGLCVFVMFLLAGLSYILPEPIKPKFLGNPNQMMIDATIGLVLLFSSYLILKTLNPALVGEGGTAGAPSSSAGTQQTEARPLPVNAP
jgi:hypothetical protein